MILPILENRNKITAGSLTFFCSPLSLIVSKWLGWEDSNLRIQVPKTCVLPLDDTPIFKYQITNPKFQIISPIPSFLKEDGGDVK
jgi:hypothetical protein